MSLIFYDTETTGVETFFDQILQFSAIKANPDLSEIDRFEIRCRILPHVVPAPGAMRVTGVRASQLTDMALPSHYEMIRAVRAKLLSWSPSVFVGWNSIAFDENLLRQAFYKTLHNPYLTNSNGNSRSDIMRLCQACSISSPDALVFPTNDKGEKIFRLDRIAPANGFKHDRAHDAMGDVEATIFICRLIAERAPDLWSSFMRFSKKATVVDYINEESVFGISEFYFGKPYSYTVTTVGQNPTNGAEWYVYDLSVPPETLQSFSELQLAKRLKQKPKPIRKLKSNAAPMLFSAEDALQNCSIEHDLKELERRAKILQADTELRERLVSVSVLLKDEYPVSPHIEKQIYDKFIERSDEALMEAFHATSWEERYLLVGRFQDERLKAIGSQLIYLERPQFLDKATYREHHLTFAKRLVGQVEDVSWLTLPKALDEISAILAVTSDAELEFFQEHHAYLDDCHTRAQSHLMEQ